MATEELAMGITFLIAIVTVILGSLWMVYKMRNKKEGKHEYEPPSQVDKINNNLKMINETLSNMKEERAKKELENNIEEGYRVKLRVADGHTAFGGTYYTITEHLIEADNFMNDGDWITLYKKDKKVATHPTKQVEFITKL